MKVSSKIAGASALPHSKAMGRSVRSRKHLVVAGDPRGNAKIAKSMGSCGTQCAQKVTAHLVASFAQPIVQPECSRLGTSSVRRKATPVRILIRWSAHPVRSKKVSSASTLAVKGKWDRTTSAGVSAQLAPSSVESSASRTVNSALLTSQVSARTPSLLSWPSTPRCSHLRCLAARGLAPPRTTWTSTLFKKRHTTTRSCKGCSKLNSRLSRLVKTWPSRSVIRLSELLGVANQLTSPHQVKTIKSCV